MIKPGLWLTVSVAVRYIFIEAGEWGEASITELTQWTQGKGELMRTLHHGE